MASFDLIVIGGGSAGFHAARIASEQGKRVGLIEAAEDFGGLCILRGCMPTKTMLRTAEVAQLIRGAGELAIKVSAPKVDWNGLVRRRNRLVQEFADFRRESAENLPNVEIIREFASFDSPSSVRVGGRSLTAAKFVIATGSIVWKPEIPGLKEVGFITSDEAQILPRLPSSILILGGGAVAAEFAQLFQRVGAQVFMVQRSPLCLSKMDADIAQTLQACLEEEGVKIETSARLIRFEMLDGLKSCLIETPSGIKRIAAEEVLCALGRKPAIEGLNCAAAGVRLADGWVVVDDYLRTSNPNIFAAGDVAAGEMVGEKQLAHVAVQQGELIGYNAFNRPMQKFDTRLVPEAIFTDPSIGAVGMTEAEAVASGRPILTAIEKFADQGKAITMNQTRGLVKMIADAATGEILGVHIVGPEAADLIHEAVVAMYYRATVQEFVKIPHLHPTLAEILVEPAAQIVSQMRAGHASQPAAERAALS